MIHQLLVNIIWSFSFAAFLFVYTGIFVVLGMMLEKRIGTIWALVVTILLNVIFLNICFALALGVVHV